MRSFDVRVRQARMLTRVWGGLVDKNPGNGVFTCREKKQSLYALHQVLVVGDNTGGLSVYTALLTFLDTHPQYILPSVSLFHLDFNSPSSSRILTPAPRTLRSRCLSHITQSSSIPTSTPTFTPWLLSPQLRMHPQVLPSPRTMAMSSSGSSPSSSPFAQPESTD